MTKFLIEPLAVVVELAMLYGFGVGCADAAEGRVEPWLAGALAVVAVATLWGFFLAPRARRRLRGRASPLAKAALFLCAGLLAWRAGWDRLALFLLIGGSLAVVLEFRLSRLTPDHFE
jgi:hypothetical protein